MRTRRALIAGGLLSVLVLFGMSAVDSAAAADGATADQLGCPDPSARFATG